MIRKLFKGLTGLLAIIGIAVGLAALLAYPTMLLWNYVVTAIFNLPIITFWQAMALLILSNLLFKNSSTSTFKTPKRLQ